MADNTQTDLSGYLSQLFGPQPDQNDTAISGFTPQNTTGTPTDEENASPNTSPALQPHRTFGQRLKDFGVSFAKSALTNLGQSMQQRSNPTLFAEQQENQRQQAQMAQEMFRFKNLSEYQTQELGQRQAEVEQAEKEDKANRSLANIKWLQQQHGEGNIVETTKDDPEGSLIEGHYVKSAPGITMNVPDELHGLFKDKTLPVNKSTQGVIERIFGSYETGQAKKKVQDPKFLQNSLDQIDKIYPTTPVQQEDAGGVDIPQFSPANPTAPQLAYSHNNPGNLKFAGQAGAKSGTNGYAKFASPEEGYAALHNQIALDSHRGLNLAQYVAKYAPPAENNTGQYIFQAMDALGAKGSTPLSQIDPEKLAQWQIRKESGASVRPPSTPTGNSDATDNAKFAGNYKSQIQNMWESGDTAGINKLVTSITDSAAKAKRDADAAGQKVTAEDKANMAQAKMDIPDEKLDWMYKQVKSGAVSAQDAEKVLGISDKYGRRRWLDYLGSRGDPLPVPLDGPSRTHLAAIEPVLDSLKKLKVGIAPYAKSDTPGQLAGKRLMYSLGIGDPDGSGGLISTGEMDRIRGATQSLTGLRSNLTTLEQAQIHTPNFWKDSGRLMNDKVDKLIEYLTNQEDKIYKFGAKSGVVQPSGTPTSTGTVPAGKVRVRRKSDGQTGMMSPGFDTTKYEEVK